MRQFVFVFIALLLIFSCSCRNIRERGLFGKKAKTLEMLRAQQDSIRVADSLKRVENRLRAVEEARLDSLIQAEQERIDNEARNKYNIVVGSFLTPEFALAWADEYRKQGYDSKIVRMAGSQFDLVVAESYDKWLKAIERLEAFQDTVDIDTWLYINK